MTKNETTRQLGSMAGQGNGCIGDAPAMVAHPAHAEPSAREPLIWCEHARPDVADRRGLAYASLVSANPLARVCQPGRLGARAPFVRFFSARNVSMVGRSGSLRGAGPSPGLGRPEWPASICQGGGGLPILTRRPTMTKHTPGVSAPFSAADLFAAIFHPHREPRSEAYRAGCLAALRYRLGEVEHIECPYPAGTAEADAFHAGTAEGHTRGREAMEVRHG